MKTISQQFEDTIDTLMKKGFNSEATEIRQIKESIQQGLFDVERFRRPAPRFQATPSPKQPSKPEPFAKPEEYIMELNPQTGKETIKMFKDVHKKYPMVMDDLLEYMDEVSRGKRDPEFLFNAFKKAPPEVKKVMEDAMKMTLQRHDVKVRKASYKLKLASEDAFEKGYDAISRRLLKASEELSKIKEKHDVFSLESIYQKADDLKDFWGDLERFTKAMEEVTKIIRSFDDRYKEKVLNKVDNKEIDDKEAIEKTIDLVRGADKEIQKKIKQIAPSK